MEFYTFSVRICVDFYIFSGLWLFCQKKSQGYSLRFLDLFSLLLEKGQVDEDTDAGAEEDGDENC